MTPEDRRRKVSAVHVRGSSVIPELRPVATKIVDSPVFVENSSGTNELESASQDVRGVVRDRDAADRSVDGSAPEERARAVEEENFSAFSTGLDSHCHNRSVAADGDGIGCPAGVVLPEGSLLPEH